MRDDRRFERVVSGALPMPFFTDEMKFAIASCAIFGVGAVAVFVALMRLT